MCDSCEVVKTPFVLAVAAALLLAGCSSSPSASTAGSTPEIDTNTSASAARSDEPVGVSIGSSWNSMALVRDRAGYALVVDGTSDPDVFDARLTFQEEDGAVQESSFLTLRVTNPSTMRVQWPDGAERDGTLRLDPDARNAVALDLGPGCIATLPPDTSPDNCFFRPRAATDAPSAAATPTPSRAPAAPLPTADEAMGYLCSVGVDELPAVTSSSADPFAVAVLQTALTQIGYQPGEIDGRYGRVSKAAVRAFQTDAGLTVDALVGPQTWTRLQADACSIGEDPAG